MHITINTERLKQKLFTHLALQSRGGRCAARTLMGVTVSLDKTSLRMKPLKPLDFCHPSMPPPHPPVKALIWHQTYFFPL